MAVGVTILYTVELDVGRGLLLFVNRERSRKKIKNHMNPSPGPRVAGIADATCRL